MTDAETTLTVILGATIGSLVRSGTSPDEIRQMVDMTLKAISQMDQAEMQRLMSPVADYAITAAMDAQEGST